MPSRRPRPTAADEHVRIVRASGRDGMVIPVLFCAPYLAVTWGAPHRRVMAAVAAVMLLSSILTFAAAGPIGRSRMRVPLQMAGIGVTAAGCTLLAYYDGGVAGPLGALLPYSVLFYAVSTPPRVFAVSAVVSAVGFWLVAFTAGAGPPGYAFAYTIGIGGIATLCMRYSAAMASLRRRLAELSRIDPLTGCLNRRGFDEHLGRVLAEADRSGTPAALLLVDLDRFKEINDTLGHQAGDELLVRTGRALAAELRGHDAVGRIGGDEFAVALSGVDRAGAVAVVARLRVALADVTGASIGYASYPAEAANARGLTHLADERVYEDKISRDRRPVPAPVVTGEPVPETPALATVSQHERRRRAIADSGWLGMFDPGVGLIYIAFFAAGQPHRWLMGGLLSAAFLIGLTTLVLAGPVSRMRTVGMVMFAVGVAQFAIAYIVISLDGGVSGTLGLGMLVPMPLIALTTPSVGRPLLGAIVGAYLAMAYTVGGAGTWYVVTYLGLALAVSVACARRGRVAAQQRRRLSELSRVDGLTQCLNRRGFTERFTVERTQPYRHDRDVSLLIFDLDGFKQVNDVHGHAAGDDLLCWVAATLQADVGPDDVVGRLGGDEFVVLLTKPAGRPVTAVAGTLQAALAERTAASVGTAVLGRDGDDFDALYARADAELYTCKAARGRGRSRRTGQPTQGRAPVGPECAFRRQG